MSSIFFVFFSEVTSGSSKFFSRISGVVLETLWNDWTTADILKQISEGALNFTNNWVRNSQSYFKGNFRRYFGMIRIGYLRLSKSSFRDHSRRYSWRVLWGIPWNTLGGIRKDTEMLKITDTFLGGFIKSIITEELGRISGDILGILGAVQGEFAGAFLRGLPEAILR